MKTFRKSTQALVYCLWCVSYPLGVASHLNPCKKANSGANTNGCQVCTVVSLSRLALTVLQFFITTAKCDFLDGKHVVFGKVIDGMLTLRKIENVPTGPNNRPKLAVKIVGKSL